MTVTSTTIKGQKGEWQTNFWKSLPYPKIDGIILPLIVQSIMSNSATPWTAALQASLSFTVAQSLLKLMSIESVKPSNHFILCHHLLLLPSVFASIRVFSNESVLHIWWPKDWSFSFSISPSNEFSGLISFRTDWSCSPRVSEESSPAPQFEGINSSVLSLLYGLTPHP